MREIDEILSNVRKVSFFLFLFPSLAIVFSLIITNFLVSYDKYTSLFVYETESFFSKNKNLYLKDNFTRTLICNESNEFCLIKDLNNQLSKNYFDCQKNKVYQVWHYNNKDYSRNEIIELISDESGAFYFSRLDKKKLKYINFIRSKELNKNCIKNSNLYWLYNNFPISIKLIDKIKSVKGFSLGVSEVVNPFFYGETSISNIVKRIPISYFFKTLMYISCVLMFVYWRLNNIIAKEILNENKNFSFYTIGIMSAIFLFFHVLFLGMEIESEIFKKIRRIIIVLFILFEIVAQTLLIVNIKKNINNFLTVISKKVLLIKQILISFMIIATIVILIILSFYDLSSSFDYFLEWNYFQILLFFYLLSYFLWKKKIN